MVTHVGTTLDADKTEYALPYFGSERTAGTSASN